MVFYSQNILPQPPSLPHGILGKASEGCMDRAAADPIGPGTDGYDRRKFRLARFYSLDNRHKVDSPSGVDPEAAANRNHIRASKRFRALDPVA